MSEISEIEIKSMTKEQNYIRGYEDGKSDVLDKICCEISNVMIKYPKAFSDKVYDAVTICEGIEEVKQAGVRRGLELAISIIKAESENKE